MKQSSPADGRPGPPVIISPSRKKNVDGLEIGKTYRDKRGRDWTVRTFLTDAGRWFVDDPEGDYVHVLRPLPNGKQTGKFIRRRTFYKSLETFPPPLS